MQDLEIEQGASSGSDDLPRRDLARLPKAEMHLHLLGAMRESTLVELAAAAGRPAPDPRVFTTFDDFQKIFLAAFAATQTRPENLLRLVREVVADAAADGVVWVQPHFDPHIYSAFGPPEEVMEAVLAEGRAAAVDHLGATRIAHGIHAADDPALLAVLAQRGVTLDVCLTSNAKLGVVPDMTQHPLPRLLAAGVPCSLGADDPLMFGVGLLDEYHAARTVLGLDDRQLAELARTSITSSGAPAALKATAVSAINSWLAT